ncbi:MAG TPA: Tad domain-containing protein [Candidatus Acidoferrales bacterium]|nr:Tad domain-containing protein [Candidatus Acidoferrales bacterium]
MKNQNARHFARSESGQMVVLAAIVMMVLLFFVGLAVDAGQLFIAKRSEQEAADSAAFAGAIVFYKGGSQPPSAPTVTLAVTQARTVAALNGYTGGCALTTTGSCYDAASATTVTVNYPPVSGAYSGNLNHIEVEITRQVRTSLVPAEALFNPVRARGVAGAESYNSGYSLISLDPNCDNNVFAVQPNMDIHLNGGGVLVNSCGADTTSGFTSTQDFTITGSPTGMDIVGGSIGDTFPPAITVNTGVPPLADPFAGYPKPPCCGGLPVNSTGYGGNTAFAGVWTGNLSGVSLCGGIYILQGGGMGGDIGRDTTPGHIDPNTGLPCDGKSFIFNTMSNYPATSGGSCSQIGQNGNHPITIRPMTTGTWSGMQIYQDPRCAVDVQIGGNQTLDAGGTIYIPSATLHLNGNPATIDGGQLIAYKLDIQNGNLNINYNAGNSAQPILPRLSE